MGLTQNRPQGSISQDSIAGERHSSRVTALAQAVAQVVQTQTAAATAGRWRNLYRYLYKLTRALRVWVTNEQLTAFFGGHGIEAQISNLAYNDDTWIDLIRTTYSPPGAGSGEVKWPVRNQHVDIINLGLGYTVFRAPQTADYIFHVKFKAVSTNAAGDDLIIAKISTREHNTAAWQDGISIAGASNVSADISTVVFLNGSYLVRLNKGNMVRFGLRQQGKSATHANIDSAEMTVFVSKAKFYPRIST